MTANVKVVGLKRLENNRFFTDNFKTEKGLKVMAWTYLLVAGIFEIVWATGMKYSDSFRNLLPSTITILAMVFSFFFLSKALKNLPLGTGYAVWTGIGTIGTTIVGIILFGEPREISRVFCIILILFGIFGLKLVSTQ